MSRTLFYIHFYLLYPSLPLSLPSPNLWRQWRLFCWKFIHSDIGRVLVTPGFPIVFSSLFLLSFFFVSSAISLCFSRAQFCVCLSFIPLPRRSERFEGSIFDRSPSLQRLTVDVSDSRASMLDRPAAIPRSILRPSKSLCCILALTNIACTLYFLSSYFTMSLSPD